MLTFLSKKTKTEFLNPEGEFKDWKDAWPEIESLGNRLDVAREMIKQCKPGTWAHNHWTLTANKLFTKWKLTVTLYQCGLRQRGPQRSFHINYEWFEGSDEAVGWLPVPAFLNMDFINDWFNHGDLHWSWEKARDEKLQKARQGLA